MKKLASRKVMVKIGSKKAKHSVSEDTLQQFKSDAEGLRGNAESQQAEWHRKLAQNEEGNND